MTTPTPADLRAAAAIERMIIAKIKASRGANSHDAVAEQIANNALLHARRHAHARASALEALADEMEG